MFTPMIDVIPETISIDSGSINEIIEIYLDKYPSYHCFNKLNNVIKCGTGKLGYHIDVCDNCAESRAMANPCDNSLCPCCQKRITENWIRNRNSDLLPVPYFHLIFNPPSELSILTMYNKKIVFDIFFNAVAAAINKIPNRDNIEIGYILSLHTSGGNLWFHPHIHVCLPGIGILKDGKLNKYSCKQALPFTEEILSQEFRRSFIDQLKKVYDTKNVEMQECDENNENEIETICSEDDSQITWPPKLKALATDRSEFDRWIEKLEKMEWRAKLGDETQTDAKELLRYIGRRTVITDDEIVEVDSERVIFLDKGKERELTIQEFVRRLVSHAMPKGLHRIRNYGFLGNNVKEKKISYILGKLGKAAPKKEKKVNKCQECQKGQMRGVAVILGNERVKTFPEQIEKLKQIPWWLSILKQIESAKEIPDELRGSIPFWLMKLFESVD
jgi:hypothetical protein